MASTMRIVDIATHFWSKVEKTDNCWTWKGRRNTARGGYGMFDVRRVTVRAHRFAYELVNGPIPAGFEVCHRCDDPRCVRPDHLFLGTRKENAADCQSKGRTSRGEGRYDAKLSDDTVREIRQLYATVPRQRNGRPYGRGPLSVRGLAQRFGVTPSAIHLAVRGRTWRHVNQ